MIEHAVVQAIFKPEVVLVATITMFTGVINPRFPFLILGGVGIYFLLNPPV